MRLILNNWIRFAVVAVVALVGHGSVANPEPAVSASSTDARLISEAVQKRDDGDRIVANMTMTIKEPSGRQRVRRYRQYSKDFVGGTKSVLFFSSPADMVNTGFLTIDYRDGGQEDDQWLYLPSLKRATRLTASGKSGSFLGSDFTYADLSTRNTGDYEFEMIKSSVDVDGEECWLIEARPRTDKERDDTGYLKLHSWVSKSKLMALQWKAWQREGRRMKYFKLRDIRKVQGVWVPHRVDVRSIRGNELESSTELQVVDIEINAPSVTDADFTTRRLEQGL